MPRAEAWAEIVIAVAMFAAIAALFVLDPSSHEVDPGVFTLCVGMLALSHAARIDLPNAWTSPVQLALVPTVFLLPAWLVPLTLITAIVIARMPEVIRGGTPPSRLLLTPGNAWFTVGPAAVLLAAGSPSPQDVAPVLLVAMLVAQIGTDFVISSFFLLLTRSVSLRQQLHESVLVYGIDAALAPVGFLAALAIDESPYYLLLLAPIFGILAVFAGERRTRLTQLTELNGAYRGTALVLAEVVDADDAYTGEHTRDVVALSVTVAEAARARRARPSQRRVRCAAARRRQGRDPQGDHQQARAAGRCRVGDHAHPHDRGPADARPRRRLHARGRADRPRLARALRRRRLPRRPGRRGDPVRGAHHHGLRRVQRDDHHAAVSRGERPRHGGRRAGPLRRHAVRPEGGRGAPRRGRPDRGTRHAPARGRKIPQWRGSSAAPRSTSAANARRSAIA